MPSQSTQPSRLLTPKEAAAFIGRSMSIMANERCFGGGPKFIKLGQSVRFDLRHLEEYIAARVRLSTSDDGERAGPMPHACERPPPGEGGPLVFKCSKIRFAASGKFPLSGRRARRAAAWNPQPPSASPARSSRPASTPMSRRAPSTPWAEPAKHFLREVEAGASIPATLETYGRLPVEFVRALGGDKFAPIVHVGQPMSGRGMAQKSIDLIEHSRRILAAIQPTTVRSVCYQLFTHGLIEDMGSGSTHNVSRLLVIAREKGIIPWEWIVDETRQEEHEARHKPRSSFPPPNR